MVLNELSQTTSLVKNCKHSFIIHDNANITKETFPC